MAPSPKPIDPYLNVMKPFDLYGWALILLSLLATSLTLVCIYDVIATPTEKRTGGRKMGRQQQHVVEIEEVGGGEEEEPEEQQIKVQRKKLNRGQLEFFAWRILMKQGK